MMELNWNWKIIDSIVSSIVVQRPIYLSSLGACLLLRILYMKEIEK